MDPETRKWFYGSLAVIAIIFILFFLASDYSGSLEVKPKWLGHEVQAVVYGV